MLTADDCQDIRLNETLYVLNEDIGSITPGKVIGMHPISGGNYKSFDLQTKHGAIYRDVALGALFRSFRAACRAVVEGRRY